MTNQRSLIEASVEVMASMRARRLERQAQAWLDAGFGLLDLTIVSKVGGDPMEDFVGLKSDWTNPSAVADMRSH